MASTHEVFVDPRTGRKTVVAEVSVAISAGAGSEVITIDETFNNEPTMFAVPPLGADTVLVADWAVTYTAGTPSLTLTIANQTSFNGTTLQAVVVAVDRTDKAGS